MEDGPAGTAVEGDRAAMALLDDAPAGVEAETGAGPDLLGGEERVEDPVPILLRDARAVVADVDLHAVAVAARADRDRAGLPERLDRVVEDVLPHLVELGAAPGGPRAG